MRKILAVAVLLGTVGLTAWAQDEPPPPRYGVPPNLDLFPQDTPQAALSSAVKAVEKGRIDYLAAHLIDPKFIDDRVAERARLLEKEVAVDLRALREAQARSPDVTLREDRVPADPKGFDEAVRREAARRAFRLIARDIRGTLDENPDHLRELGRFLRDGANHRRRRHRFVGVTRREGSAGLLPQGRQPLVRPGPQAAGTHRRKEVAWYVAAAHSGLASITPGCGPDRAWPVGTRLGRGKRSADPGDPGRGRGSVRPPLVATRWDAVRPGRDEGSGRPAVPVGHPARGLRDRPAAGPAYNTPGRVLTARDEPMTAAIDLRSDTVTKPTPGMRAAMSPPRSATTCSAKTRPSTPGRARRRPTVGKEAALFVPSGTMANQIAVRLHCRPGDELLCETTSHIYNWEAGGPAALSGVTMPDDRRRVRRPRRSASSRARSARPTTSTARPHPAGVPGEHAQPRRRPGLPAGDGPEVSAWARRHGLAMHLDGARLWNAVVATGVPAREWCGHFDTVSVCFSKGLGAPVGSALAGPRELIAKARRVRKLFGGAMRQAGFLAAACLYAMDHHVERLAEDHANAKLIAAAVAGHAGADAGPAGGRDEPRVVRGGPGTGHRPAGGRAADGNAGYWSRRSGKTVVRAVHAPGRVPRRLRAGGGRDSPPRRGRVITCRP